MAKSVTRKKILEAAEELFSRNGYDGTPTRTIARKAGITEMTLFNHFSNKEMLYKTVVRERYLAADIDSAFSALTYADLENDLKRISAKLIDNFQANKNILLMRLKEKQSFQNEKIFRLEQGLILEKITPVFQRYEKTGVIGGSGKSVARQFIVMVKGLFYVCLMDDKRADEMNETLDLHVKTFCHGVVVKCRIDPEDQDRDSVLLE